MHRILNKKAKQSKTMQTVFGLKKSEIPANGNDLPGFLHQIRAVAKRRVEKSNSLEGYFVYFCRHLLKNKKGGKTGKRAIWEKLSRY